MAVCYHPSHMCNLDDNVANYGDVSHLAQLDIHHNSQSILFLGNVFLGCLLPCLCQRIGTTYTTRKVYLHQRNCFLLLLAGKRTHVLHLYTWLFSLLLTFIHFLQLSLSFEFCIKFTRNTAIIINKQDVCSCLEYKA